MMVRERWSVGVDIKEWRLKKHVGRRALEVNHVGGSEPDRPPRLSVMARPQDLSVFVIPGTLQISAAYEFVRIRFRSNVSKRPGAASRYCRSRNTRDSLLFNWQRAENCFDDGITSKGFDHPAIVSSRDRPSFPMASAAIPSAELGYSALFQTSRAI